MSSKKYISTYLLVTALICLLTLVIPFTQVGFIGVVPTVLKIFYYIFLVLYIICLSIIIAVGIFNLFKNSFEFAVTQEILSYCALFCVLLTIVIFAPNVNGGLSVGYSILTFETFLLSCFNSILTLIKEMPKNFELLKKALKAQKEKLKKIDENIENETINIMESEEEQNSEQNIQFDGEDEVLIIPSDETNED